MAEFTTQFGYLGTYDGTNFTTSSSAFGLPQTATDNEAAGAGSTTFESGDTIEMESNVLGDDNFSYIGHTSDGWLGQGTTTSQFIFFSNSATYGNPEEIGITTDPLPVCFLSGTRILTPLGERAVEALAIGDMVLTATGEARQVRWIGRQTVVALFAKPLHAYPIRIRAGALADDMPVRDLYVSPDHALEIEGVLVHAGALVNGESIVRVPRPDERFSYYHIELADHALVLAEGAPAETFIDNVTRRRFDNYGEYEALYGTSEKHMVELDLPRAMSARQVPQSIRTRIANRATILRPQLLEAV